MGPADSDASLERLVREHAALRRVATLVAREPSPGEVFEAVAREVGTLLGARRAQLVASAKTVLARAREQLDGGLSDLRDLARGIHPSMLTDRGLAVALEGLAKRAPMPVELHVAVQSRLDQAIEAAAYFLVSEAITNAAKHARAESVSVDVQANGDTMLVTVADDGVGGAETTRGSGLRGLIDRVEAVGGRLEITSPSGDGTRLSAGLPTNVLGGLNGIDS